MDREKIRKKGKQYLKKEIWICLVSAQNIWFSVGHGFDSQKEAKNYLAAYWAETKKKKTVKVQFM